MERGVELTFQNPSPNHTISPSLFLTTLLQNWTRKKQEKEVYVR